MNKLQPNKYISKHLLTTVFKVTTTDLHPEHTIGVMLVDLDGNALDYPFEVEVVTDEYKQLKKKTRKVKI